MKVAWLCNYNLNYLKDVPGLDLNGYGNHPSTWIEYLSRELAENHDIDLYIFSFTNFIRKDICIRKRRIEYNIISSYSKRSGNRAINQVYRFHRIMREIKTRNSIIRKIKKLNPDILTIHGTELFSSIGGYPVKIRKNGIPAVLWMQGILNVVLRSAGDRIAAVLKKNEADFFRTTRYFVTKKGNMEAEIGKYNSNPVFFNIFYPVSNFCFELYNKKTEPERDLVFAGSLIKRKGIEDFIKMIAALKAKGLNITSAAIGKAENPAYLEYLEKMVHKLGIEDNITFLTGITEHENVLLEMKKSGILVLPTYADSAPVVVAESMSMGVPVVAYDVDGLPEMIRNGWNGILVEKENISRLADAVENLLDDAKKREEISVHAFEFAREQYFAPVVAQKTMMMYKEIINDFKSISA